MPEGQAQCCSDEIPGKVRLQFQSRVKKATHFFAGGCAHTAENSEFSRAFQLHHMKLWPHEQSVIFVFPEEADATVHIPKTLHSF